VFHLHVVGSGPRGRLLWDASFAVACAVAGGFALVRGRYGFAAFSAVIAVLTTVRCARHWAGELPAELPTVGLAADDPPASTDTDPASAYSVTSVADATPSAVSVRSVVIGGMVFSSAVGIYVMLAVGGPTGVDVGWAIAGVGVVTGGYFLRDPSRR
jgi:hypothetical protein